MSKHSQIAMELFKQGYNCAQSITGSFCDELELTFEEAVKLASSFGGGMGRLREVCGAVTGMFMVTGLKYGYSDPCAEKAKAEHYALIQSLGAQFKQRNGSIICRDLLGTGSEEQSPVPEKRTEKYYQERPCIEIIGYAAEMLDNLIEIKKTEGNLMKIAVASEGKMVTGHFGHCESFNIYDIENNQIAIVKAIPNPGHKPGFLPNFLNDMGVNVIIAGGMGSGAVEIFKEKGIEVITGAQGSSEAAVNNYLLGNLQSTGSVCHEHQHHGECGG